MNFYTSHNRQLPHLRLRGVLQSKQSRYRAKARELIANFTEHDPQKRLIALISIVIIVIVLFSVRLFYLQILQGKDYLAQAYEQQYAKVIIPAKRGEILTKNPKTGELNKLATNVTLDLIYIDPKEVPDKAKVAREIAPILFGEEDFLACKEDYKKCPSGGGVQFEKTQVLEGSSEEAEKIKIDEGIKDTRTKEQLIKDYEAEILKKINKNEVDYSPLTYGATDEMMTAIEKMGIIGITVVRNKNLIYADPLEIDQSQVKNFAKILAPVFQEKEKIIQSLLTRRPVRYVPLKRRLSPEASESIWKLKTLAYEAHKKDVKNIPHYYKGVVLVPEHWRYYPEKEIASTVVGYVDNEGIGRYGIEEKFQSILQGQQGEIMSKNDVNGSQLVFDTSKEAVDGDSVVITLDRTVQSKVYELLKDGVERYHADSGTVVIMEPFSGEIIAMENYPNFNPNNFGEVYELRPASKKEMNDPSRGIYFTQPVFIKNEKGDFEQVNGDWLREEKENIQKAKDRIARGEKDKDVDGNPKDIEVPQEKQKYVYKNRFGLESYINRAVMQIYEPGSVFKPLVMATGLDAGEVTPTETYNETGPIEIDTGTGQKQYIRTALNVYRGIQTMTNALEYSSNIGMSYVARKLGKALFYKYILDFGFGDYTYIELSGEQKGGLEYWKKWTEAKLLTTSFGQGISVTPLQMVSAWGALANGGILMQPHIVKEIIKPDGTKVKTDPKVIRRVISEEASKKITGMLVSTVDHGAAGKGKIDGYKNAGKTGTAQIACSDSHRCQIGFYEKGEGTVATSYMGFAPVKNPKFVILVKFQRPRLGYNTWGENTAAPIFKGLMSFLTQYYDIPPDDL